MKVLVLGASGKTGIEVVHQGMAAGHEITAFVRDPGRLKASSPQLAVKVGDARSIADLSQALEGQEAVISTLGSNKAADALIAKSTGALLEAAGKTGLRRVVMLSVARNYKPTLFIRLMARIMAGVVADRWAGEDSLKDSGLDWTIVYPAKLTDGPRTGRVRTVDAGDTVTFRSTISRADVAEFLLARLTDSEAVGKAFVVTS
jgi:putative NADH-flavin reductase